MVGFYLSRNLCDFRFGFEKNKKKKNESISFLNRLESKLGELTYRHLNKSVFIRVFRHYGVVLKKQILRNKTCEEKGISSLGKYSWTYASKGFEDESELYWNEFEEKLVKINKISNQLNAKFAIFITPTIFDIDLNSVHPYFNTMAFDFSCATINPRQKLSEIATNIILI